MSNGLATEGGVEPAEIPIRPAATVMVLRDGSSGLEVFVLRRVAAMNFAPGMTVFPGGAVDLADSLPISWAGPKPSWWAEHLHTDEAAAAALVVAAVRELYEETGVLLAGPDPAARGSRPSVTEAARSAVLARTATMADVLSAAGLRLRSDLLRPWANWITPPGRTRRYDTFFFTAELPAGQRAEMLTTEADLGEWRTPQSLLAEREAGGLELMRPTLAMVNDLAAFGSVAQVMAEQRVVTAVRVKG